MLKSQKHLSNPESEALNIFVPIPAGQVPVVGSWVLGRIGVLYRDSRTGTDRIGNWAARVL